MVTYARHDGNTAEDLLPQLVNLYSTVYAEPPYSEGSDQVARFQAGFSEEASRTGFSLTAATDGGKLIGSAYGWTMAAGVWWSRADKEAPGKIRDLEKFAVMEWMVHPKWRAGGIGAQLLAQLLQDRREPWATLSADPRASARSIYRRYGWQKVAESQLPWGAKMDVLIFELASQ